MEKVTIGINGKDRIEVEKGTFVYEIAKKFQKYYKTEIVIAKSGNILIELGNRIEKSMDIDFIDLTNQDGIYVYSRSLSLVMVKAIKDLFGIETKISIEHSINGNLYCEVKGDNIIVDNEFLNKVKKEMQMTIDRNMPIERIMLNSDDAMEYASKYGMEDKARLLRYRRVSYVNVYKLGDFYDYYYGYILPFTGMLKIFDLALY